MAAKTGTLNVTTGLVGSTVAVSGLGFQPTAVIFWWNGLTAASNGTRATSRRGIGAAASASSFFAYGTYDEDAAGTSIATNDYNSTGCIMSVDNSGLMDGLADLASFDADGFTIEVRDVFPTNLLVHYLAIGGTTNVELGTLTTPGATGNQTYNNSGNFQPDATLFFEGGQINAGSGGRFTFGAATGASNQAVHSSGAADAAATGATGSYNRAGECYITGNGSPAVAPTYRAAFVSHNAGPGGFTLNWLERAATTRTVQFLSIKGGGLWNVGNLLTQTDTVTPIAVTGLGFTPTGLMLVSACKAATVQDATPGTHDELSIGAATGPSARNCCQMDSRSGNTTMFVHLASRADCIYANSDPANTSYTLEGLGDVQSFDSDGFTLIMDDADPSQAFAWFVAVGNVPAGQPAMRRTGMVNGGRPCEIGREGVRVA